MGSEMCIRDRSKNEWEERRWRLLECNEKKKGYSDFEEWDAKFDKYSAFPRMPARGSQLFNWQMTHSGNGQSGLNNRIRKYPGDEKEWDDRRQRLLKCNELFFGLFCTFFCKAIICLINE